MTFEFKAEVQPNGLIALPSDIAGQIPAGRELHVILTLETPVDSDAFRLARKLHEQSFSATEDSVYDSLA
jgi:hypothetical protein